MSFLPKLAETRADAFALLIAVPLTFLGTGFLLFLADVGTRITG